MTTYFVDVKVSSYRSFLAEMIDHFGSSVDMSITPFAKNILLNYEEDPNDDIKNIRLTVFVKFSNKDMEMFYKLSYGNHRIYEEN